MKFVYEYRTSDNAKHDGVVNAADREAAFILLKSQGIRPSRLSEAPGFFNRLFGKGKRWIAIVVLCVIAALAIVYAQRTRRELEVAVQDFSDSTRRQIVGDTAVIELGIRTGWSSVFVEEGERFLASFAVPGVPAGLKSTSEKAVEEALARSILPDPSDGIEERQIKMIVEGMKCELREYLAAGGSIVSYGNRLVDRQEAEIRYYNIAKGEVDALVKNGRPQSEILRVWGKRNDELRKMGVRLIALPE